MQRFVLKSGLVRLTRAGRIPSTGLQVRRPLATQVPEGADRETSGVSSGNQPGEFDVSQLDKLVCPLSKARLRWDPAASELICDELNVAYPVVNGIPQLAPENGRVMSTPVPGANADEIPAQPS